MSQVSALGLLFWCKNCILGVRSGNLKAASFICTYQLYMLCASVCVSSLKWLKTWTMSLLDREAEETPSCRAICGSGHHHYHSLAACDSFSSEHSHCRKVFSWASSGHLQWLPKTNPNYSLKRLMRTFAMPFFNWAIWAQLSVRSARLGGECLSEG